VVLDHHVFGVGLKFTILHVARGEEDPWREKSLEKEFITAHQFMTSSSKQVTHA
jgi:hypothetical protein